MTVQGICFPNLKDPFTNLYGVQDFVDTILSADPCRIIPQLSSAISGYFAVQSVEAALKGDPARAYLNAAKATGAHITANVFASSAEELAISSTSFVAGALIGLAPRIEKSVNNGLEKLALITSKA